MTPTLKIFAPVTTKVRQNCKYRATPSQSLNVVYDLEGDFSEGLKISQREPFKTRRQSRSYIMSQHFPTAKTVPCALVYVF